MWHISALRVVEFHNLGTTTIDIPDGGHLFLLGDNGSGKTTILDAIHLVLSAGREMEFNAAARVAGAKDSGGRTLQGIVLRYNAVSGRAMRESGVTYAAVEITSDTGRKYSLAIGISATDMDVAYERWGAIAQCGVDALPLTIRDGERERPATQGEFKDGMQRIAGGRYFPHISDYARAVGERFFGGERKYADVCKLLRTGKAYREIAAKAANYNDLFRQLLEEPNRDTFEPLIRGLRELEEANGRLEQIDERAEYLRDLQKEQERLGRLRMTLDALDWNAADSRRTAAQDAIANLTAAMEAGAEERKVLASNANELRDSLNRRRIRLDELRAKDATGLIDREKQFAARASSARRKADDAAELLAAEKRNAAASAKNEAAIAAQRSGELQHWADALLKHGKACAVAAGSLADELYAAPGDGDFAESFAALKTIVASRRDETERDAVKAEDTASSLRDKAEEFRGRLQALRKRGEYLPQIDGFSAVRENMRNGLMHQVQCVYELLEPASGCDAKTLALIEHLAGEEFLATWLVDERDADRLKREIFGAGTCGLGVAVRGTLDGVSVNEIAPWLGSFVSFETSDIDAVKLLALHLAAKFGPAKGEFLGHGTALFRMREMLAPDSRPRLIGRNFREAEQAREERELEQALAQAEREARAAEKSLAAIRAKCTALAEFAAALENSERVARECSMRLREAKAESRHAAELRDRAAAAAAERLAEFEECNRELEDIRLKMRSEGIDATLEKRIAEAAKAIAKTEAALDEVSRRTGAVESRIDALARQRDANEKIAGEAATEATAVREKLRVAFPDDEAFAGFIADVLRERSGASSREDVIGEASAAVARIEQKIRDQKGEAYSFSFDKAANRLADRRGSELRDVLDDESRRLAEIRDVISQKNREVFERIFMGDIMRRLYEDRLRINDLAGRIRRKLAGKKFGSNLYAFSIVPEPQYETFIQLVKDGVALGGAGEKDALRECLEAQRDVILNSESDAVPAIFDYRNWYRFELKVMTENEEGRVIDRRVKSMGSGGEQAVPNYLLILTVADFLYHGGDGSEPPRTAPLLFDEAFYGIDAVRRDQILAFAEDLGLQLFVSSPDQDGVKKEIKNSVSLIVVKDENLDVHLSPVVWRNTPTQDALEI